MPLPILQSHVEPTPADLVRLFLRTELHWAQHLGETTTLDVGSAIANPELNQVWDANQILDAALPEGFSPDQVFNIVNAHYASVGTECFCWILNHSLPPEKSSLLRQFLIDQGYQRRGADVMRLASIVLRPIPEIPGLKVIPARASYRHARQIAQEMTAHWNSPERAQSAGKQIIDAFERHFDDPHWDALLALRDGQPAAFIGVLAVGEVGRIEDVFVSAHARRQGIGRLMMNRAVEICARSLFKHVLLTVQSDNAPANALYRQFGFEKLGEVESFLSPGSHHGKSM